jgi:hypothetical protein
VQVRRGLYSSSVGKWRHFERQLTPLANLLKGAQPALGWHFGDESPAVSRNAGEH